MECRHCGSQNITTGISIGELAEAGWIGAQYKKGFLVGTEPFICDICKNCGEVNRIYVRNPNHDFLVKK